MRAGWIRWQGVVAVIALGGAALGCGSKPPAAPPPPGVTVAVVPEREVADWDEFTGRLQAVDAVEIHPRVSGYIQRVEFREGKEVRKGDVLFTIDPRPYQAEVERAEAELERARTGATLAQRDLARAKRLVDMQAISREEYDSRTSAQDQGVSSVRAAEAALVTARLNLDWTRVRSPITGQVGRAEVTPGNLVQSGPPAGARLTTVVSLDPVYLYFDGDEQTYLKYPTLAQASGRPPHGSPHGTAGGTDGHERAGAPSGPEVRMGLANEDGFPHRGRVDFVDNQLDPRTGTIRLRAVFENKDRRFTPGLFARVRLQGGAPRPATVVTDRAIGTDQDKKYVLVLKPDSTVDYRPIQSGHLTDDGLRVVTSGLKPGDRVVINGLMRVRPGMKVQPKLAAMTPDSVPSVAER